LLWRHKSPASWKLKYSGPANYCLSNGKVIKETKLQGSVRRTDSLRELHRTGWQPGADREEFHGRLKARLQTVTKEVGIRVLTRSLFGDGILHRLLRRVSPAKPTSAPLQF
jgi:hypothetical protein